MFQNKLVVKAVSVAKGHTKRQFSNNFEIALRLSCAYKNRRYKKAIS